MATYDNITDTIREALESAEYHYQYNEEGNVFVLGMNIPSKLSSVRCFLRETSYGFWVNAVSPIGGDPKDKEMMRTLAELITRINYPINLVKFSMDHSDGELRCEVDYPCMDEFKPSSDLVHAMLAFTTRTWTKYAPCFLAVIFAGKSAEEALKLAKEEE